MSTNKPQTRITLNIAGIAESNALTTSFSPSFQLTILRGRKALNALNDFRLLRAFYYPGITISTMLAITTMKSS